MLDVCRGIFKCRLLTGTYLLQANSYKFSKSAVSAKCRCCGLEDEDLAHKLLYCLSLANQRIQSYSKIKSMIISQIGENQWKSLFNKPEKIIKLILDCGWFEILWESKILQSLERATTKIVLQSSQQIRHFFHPKSADIFLISQQKHMLWILIRSASLRRF